MKTILTKIIVETDAILEKEIKPFGTTCHILVPREHEGKIAKVFIYKKKEDNKR